VVTAVDPQDVSRGGGTFTIIGENLYPMVIDAVLLGGNALDSANFQPGFDDDGNGEIDVTVPGGVPVGSTPVQVTTTFGDASNNDVEVRIRP
jgi:hypothetical protein